MSRLKWFVLLILAFSISSCTGVKPSEQPQRTPPPSSKKGLATITGRVVSKDTGEPITGEAIWLAEIYRQGGEGAFVLDEAHSPTGLLDDNGYFVIIDVPAKEYVIVIGNYNAEYDIPEESGTSRPKAYNLEADKILDVGEIPAKLMYHP